MAFGFLFNGRRCTGCKACVAACRDYHDLGPNLAYRQVYECTGGSWACDDRGFWTPDLHTYYVSLSCNHCEDPACTKVCPTGAMHKRDDGIVSVNTVRCIGCGYCALSCPYRAPHVDRDKGHSSKCDGCKSRIDAGKNPICVEACTQRALFWGDIDELRAAHPDGTADVVPLPPSSETDPNLVVLPSRHADAPGVAVANFNELV